MLEVVWVFPGPVGLRDVQKTLSFAHCALATPQVPHVKMRNAIDISASLGKVSPYDWREVTETVSKCPIPIDQMRQ